jgi:hypothetical protein
MKTENSEPLLSYFLPSISEDSMPKLPHSANSLSYFNVTWVTDHMYERAKKKNYHRWIQMHQ